MILSLYDFNTGLRVPHEVPDGPIEDFIRFIVETRTWRDQPERALEKLLRLRKVLLEAATPYAPEPEPEPLAPAAPAVPVSSPRRRKATAR